MATKNSTIARRIRNERPWLIRNETVPLELAERLIRKSAWWHTHSSGSPVRAPKHADRIQKSNHGWVLEFGANTFLVGKAIERCCKEIDLYIEKAAEGNMPELEALRTKLKMHIRGAVANRDGYEYNGYYPVAGEDMMFGAQSIDVPD